MTRIFFVFFLVTMCITLMNLIVGLAIGDIKKMRKEVFQSLDFLVVFRGHINKTIRPGRTIFKFLCQKKKVGKDLLKFLNTSF